MKIYVSCTANLGDFFNSFPVISGLSKTFNEKVDLIIRPEMRKFVGIKELISHQDIIQEVNFYDDLILYNTNYINLSSWTREDKNDPNRPIETCRYPRRFGGDPLVGDVRVVPVPPVDAVTA